MKSLGIPLISVLLILLVVQIALVFARGKKEKKLKRIYVCSSPTDPKFVGIYKIAYDTEMDEAAVWTHKKDPTRSFYRSNGVWQLGVMDPWPPSSYFK